MNSFLNETVPYEVQGLEAAMQYTVKSPRTWDDSMVRRFRKRPEFAVRMLNSCMEDGDQVAFLVTLRQVAKAFGGMAHVAEEAGLNETAIYRQLSAHGNPQLGSVMAILGALGLRLAVVPVAAGGVPAAQAFVDSAEGGEAPAEAEAAPA